MENNNRASERSLIQSLWGRELLVVPVYLLLMFILPIFSNSSLGADEVKYTKSYLHENFSKDGNPHRYSIAGDLYAQVIDEEVYSEMNDVNTEQGRGTGYYGTKDWQAFVSVYLWFVGMNGETGKGRAVADVDLSFGDIWDNLDVGAQAHFEFWWKKWIFFVDPLFMKLSTNSSQTRVIATRKADLEVKMFTMDLAMGYRVAEFALGQNTKSNNFKTWPAVAIDVYGGGRIIRVDTTLDLTLDTPIGQRKQSIGVDETWVDFIVGTRFMFDFTENVLLSIKSDIGGFGLGFSSDIDWNFAANVAYQLPWWGVTPYVGYRVLYIDYKDGSGDNRFVYEMWHTGPQIGLGVRF